MSHDDQEEARQEEGRLRREALLRARRRVKGAYAELALALVDLDRLLHLDYSCREPGPPPLVSRPVLA
jgi:hypothetical protein